MTEPVPELIAPNEAAILSFISQVILFVSCLMRVHACMDQFQYILPVLLETVTGFPKSSAKILVFTVTART